MDKALYIAMTAAKHNMLAQASRSNNLANINTTGFRADLEQARSMPVFYGEGSPSRAYALTERSAVNYTQGAMAETGRDLDIAIENEGFIAIQAPDGSEAYTRAGNLEIDTVGILRTRNGFPVLGEGGTPIAVPPQQKVEIATDGTMTIVGQGDGPEILVQVDRIKLVNPDVTTLAKGDDGLFRTENGQPLEADAGVSVVSGFLERSNVNAVEELTGILSLARQYEMSVNLMKTTKENSEASAQLLQIS